MTAPDATHEGRSCEVVPLADGTAEDALARVVRRHRLLRVTGGTAVGSTWVCACGETVRTPGVTRDWAETLHARHAAATVVAAVRAMSPETLAELIGGEVETGNYGVLPPTAISTRSASRARARTVSMSGTTSASSDPGR